MQQEHNHRHAEPAAPVSRREFVQTAMAASAMAAAGLQVQARAAEPKSAMADVLVGIHIAAHSFYDEGIDRCLDYLHETAAVNTLLVTSNSYYGAMFRPKEVQADHGMGVRDGRGRRVTKLWIRPREENYRDTILRHKLPAPDLEYAGKEVFADLAEPARRRGMQIHERLYEPGGIEVAQSIENWEKVLTIDLFGEYGNKPCWNNPQYLAWITACITDLFRSYPIDGIQFGAERNGPLSRLIDWPQAVPTCFCEHCRMRAAKEGVGFDRAKAGLEKMNALIQSLRKGGDAGMDGPLVAFLRLLMEYPEILAWESMHYRASEDLHKLIRETARSVNPKAHVGRHIDHAQSSWDFLFRAGLPYARMAEASDYLKISTYKDIFGPRLKTAVQRYQKHILGQFTPEQTLELFYTLLELDPQQEPPIDELNRTGLSPEYVYRETKRAVEAVAGKADVYAGIALDVPRGGDWGTEVWPSDPVSVAESVQRAFDAGANGIVVCREYEENRTESLRAVGRAVRERS
ncbi:MAG: hypothetical protein ACOY3P_20685 [Planctomycetota bacterium]